MFDNNIVFTYSRLIKNLLTFNVRIYFTVNEYNIIILNTRYIVIFLACKIGTDYNFNRSKNYCRGIIHSTLVVISVHRID